MSYNEQYQPTGSERFGFVEPSFFADLAAAEFEIDQPYELNRYKEMLEVGYAEQIYSKTYFLASGIMITIAEGFDIEEQHDDFVGRIVGFEVRYDPTGPHQLVAKLQNDNLKQSRSMVLSAREGYESSLLPDVIDEEVDDETFVWKKLDRRSLGEKAYFLGTAATELAFKTLDADTTGALAILEDLLRDDGMRVGSIITVEGIQAYKSDPNNPKIPIGQNRTSFTPEASHVGIFMGLTLYEITTMHGRKESRLCVALELEDGTVVLQPCHTAHAINLVSY